MNAVLPSKWSFQTSVMLVREAGAESIVKARTPREVRDLFDIEARMAQEAFWVILLNAKNNIIDKTMIGLGLVSSCLIHPRECFRQAIISGASAIVVVHNHPSGDPTPSAEDIRITRQLVDAGKIVDIHIIDHIIIAQRQTPEGPGFLSFREQGLVQFAV